MKSVRGGRLLLEPTADLRGVTEGRKLTDFEHGPCGGPGDRTPVL